MGRERKNLNGGWGESKKQSSEVERKKMEPGLERKRARWRGGERQQRRGRG